MALRVLSIGSCSLKIMCSTLACLERRVRKAHESRAPCLFSRAFLVSVNKSHTHLGWRPQKFDGQWYFPAKDEAEYTEDLCQFLCTGPVNQHATQPAGWSCSNAAAVHCSHGRRRPNQACSALNSRTQVARAPFASAPRNCLQASWPSARLSERGGLHLSL